MPIRTYVYRLRPSRAQHVALRTILDGQRYLYNAALQERRDAWAKNGVSISFNDQTRSLTEIRNFDDDYGCVPYNVSKWTLKRLDDAFKGFLRRVKRGGKAGFPRFRAGSRWQSFGFHQKDGLRLKDGRLLFGSGIVGGLKVKMHRPFPEGATIKSAVFTLEDGVWRVALACEVLEAVAVDDNRAIGIDVGVEWLATDSDGRHHANLRSGSKRQKELRRAARALARGRKGSARRRRTAAKLRRIQRRVVNARRTHLHDVANAIVRSASMIFVEDLKLRNMTRSARGSVEEPGVNVRQKAGLNRALADAAPGRLISMIGYKAESAGGRMIKVDPRGTSQECPLCEARASKPLAERRHVCACGTDMHRDHAAAMVILKRGQAAHEAARGLGELNVGNCPVRAPANADLVSA